MKDVKITVGPPFIKFWYRDELRVQAQVWGGPSEHGIFGSAVSRLFVEKYNPGKYTWEKLVSYERGSGMQPKLPAATVREIVDECIKERAKQLGGPTP